MGALPRLRAPAAIVRLRALARLRAPAAILGLGAFAGLGGAVALPVRARAQIVELGRTHTPVAAPACPPKVAPSKCYIILTRTTAVQTMSDTALNPTAVTRPGWLVAFTVGLSRLSPVARTEASELHMLDRTYGGPPQVALTVLRPGSHGAYAVAAESPSYHLTPLLGQVLQEPLAPPPAFSTFTALPVSPGEVVGLTVPTWAPVLSYGLSGSAFSYRQSRATKCDLAAAGQTAQLTVGATTRYLCSYAGTRVEYSATEVVNQPYPGTYVH